MTRQRLAMTRALPGLTIVGLLAFVAPAQDLPSLDEMLGLEEDANMSERGEAPADRELDRKLSAKEAGEQLARAIQLMEDAALRLEKAPDLATQRLQEDILRKLDMVIETAEQSQGRSGGSSSSAAQQQQQRQGRPASRQARGQQAGANRGENSGQANPPGLEGVELSPSTLMDDAAWGSLPDRLRGALRQGMTDEFSAAYRRLTEAYYRRLAEQAEERR